MDRSRSIDAKVLRFREAACAMVNDSLLESGSSESVCTEVIPGPAPACLSCDGDKYACVRHDVRALRGAETTTANSAARKCGR